MSKFSRAIFFENQACRLTSAEDIGWMITQAKPPFVAVYNTRASAHMLWRAPMTHDASAIGVAFGDSNVMIRPAAVLNARLALARLATIANSTMQAHYQWPVFGLSTYDDKPDLCRLIPTHERVLRDLTDKDVVRDLETFDALNRGERWALSALLLARPKRGQAISDFEQPPKLEVIQA